MSFFCAIKSEVCTQLTVSLDCIYAKFMTEDKIVLTVNIKIYNIDIIQI